MNLATRVRALEEEKIGLLERLEEEEERAKELSRQIQTHTQQVKQRPDSLSDQNSQRETSRVQIHRGFMYLNVQCVKFALIYDICIGKSLTYKRF